MRTLELNFLFKSIDFRFYSSDFDSDKLPTSILEEQKSQAMQWEEWRQLVKEALTLSLRVVTAKNAMG